MKNLQELLNRSLVAADLAEQYGFENTASSLRSVAHRLAIESAVEKDTQSQLSGDIGGKAFAIKCLDANGQKNARKLVAP